MNKWFEVDRDGLAKLVEARGKVPLVLELLSNAWDAPGVTHVEVHLRAVPSQPLVEVEVIDNSPEGFVDLEHAWTLYAPSAKVTDAAKRGRFNLGEKLALAACKKAHIETTSGTVFFDEDGGRRRSRMPARERGTRFHGLMRMTRAELEPFHVVLRRLQAPEGITTYVRIEGLTPEGASFEITHRKPLRTFSASLPTLVADDEGVLRPRERETLIEVFEDRAVDGLRQPMLHELGVPVVEIGGLWHVNVLQKVPLNKDRDNVPPSYLRRVRAAVLNVMHDKLTEATVRDAWVTEALETAAVDTLSSVLDLRFGKKRVAYDPSDLEANKRAAADGYAVVSGGSLPGVVWERVRLAGAIKPAGQVTPTRRLRFSPDGVDAEVPPARWTHAQRRVTDALKTLAAVLLANRTGVSIRIVSDSTNRFAAWYGRGGFLTLNVQVLGHRWFDAGAEGLQEQHLDLLLHELGHEWCEDHLSKDYYDALTRLGAALAMRVAEDPRLGKLLQQKGAV